MLVKAGGYVYTLADGQPLPIQAGRTLRVFYTFSYKVAAATAVPVWGSLYRKTLGAVNRVEQAQTKTSITLDPALTWQTGQGQIDIKIDSRVAAGIYGLIVELPGFAEARVDDCIEVTAAPGLSEWMSPLIMIAMMGMMAQMAAPMAEGID